MKIKNSDINGLMKSEKGKGLDKLMNHPNFDSDKAYDLSLLVPKIEDQYNVLEENRKRISKKFFPMNEKTEKQDTYLEKNPVTGKFMTHDNKEATEKEIDIYKAGLAQFKEEFDAVLEKEVELEGEKVEISRKKDEKTGRSELQNLNLTVVDLLVLSPIISVTK